MAKLKMKYVSLFAMQKDRKAVLERLQQMSVMDIETASLDEETSFCPEGFHIISKQNEANSFERNAAVAKQSLDILDEFVPEKKSMLSSLAGRREVGFKSFCTMSKEAFEILHNSYNIIGKEKKIDQIKSQRVQINSMLAQLEPWKKLDVPLSFSGTKLTAAFIGSLPFEYDSYKISEILQKKITVDFEFELIGTAKGISCIFILCMKSDEKELEQALRELGFARPHLISHKRPKDKCEQYEERLIKLQEEETDCINAIKEYSKYRNDIEKCCDYYTTRAEKYEIIGTLSHSKNTFMVRGYVPEIYADSLKNELENEFEIAVEIEQANEDLQPVMLKNNAFVEPAENITTMYSMPNKKDIDPSALMSFFYYLFFGMMLSDAGYGLIMIIGSLLLIKKYKPEKRMKNNFKLFIYCGISTVFWGLMFGSFFGDSIATLSQIFTGTKVVQKPLLFDPMQQATYLLIMSLTFGFIQIICGLCAKFYMLWKDNRKVDAICDVGLWITALCGVGMLAAGIAIPVIMTLGTVIAVISAAGILFTAGRNSKGPMKFLAGLKELYGSTGYISDFMSYSRLMALGLTTGAMGSVFNMLSAMMGTGIIAIIPMILIFIIGHAINFGLNALGAYVHTIRLQYVELFSKFYEGGGREFKPFSFNGKFVRVKNKD